MLKSTSLRTKLIIAFVFVASLVGASSYFQYLATRHNSSAYESVVENDMIRLQALQEARYSISVVRHQMWHGGDEHIHPGLQGGDSATSGNEMHTQETEPHQDVHSQEQAHEDIHTDHSSVTEPEENDRSSASIDVPTSQEIIIERQWNVVRSSLSQYQELLSEDTVHEGLSSSVAIDKLVDDAEFSRRDTFAYLHHVSLSQDPVNDPVAIEHRASLDMQFDSLVQRLNATVDLERSTINQDYIESKLIISDLTRRSITAGFIPAILAIAIGYAFAGSITRKIERLRTGANHIATGDFSYVVRKESFDELGYLTDSFNQMSERLRNSYHRLAVENQQDEALLESMGEGMVAIDTDEKIVMLNHKAVELLGLPNRESVVGVKFTDRVVFSDEQEEQLPLDKQPSSALLQKGGSINGIYSLNMGSKGSKFLGVTAGQVNLEGKVMGGVLVIRDVTKEREVDRMKTEFISLASHQLRTPLSATKWFSELLLSDDVGELSEEQKEFAQKIYDSTERMIELVSSLLNISRIESGRIIVDPVPTDLKELVSGIIDDLQAKTQDRKQSLVISVHKDLPKINLDPRLISQVYMNLLTNAVKYTPEGGEISVFISKKDDKVISQVSDNGYGIPKSQQERVFNKFFRGENVVDVETDGTGLGLYLIKAIVESSGGDIWFESEESKGTTFWFTLPLSGMEAKEGEVTLEGGIK